MTQTYSTVFAAFEICLSLILEWILKMILDSQKLKLILELKYDMGKIL